LKKLLAILLCLVMLLPIFTGCNEEETPKETTGSHSLQVGFGRVDISPKESVPLKGHGGNTAERMSQGVLDPLYATCVAFADEKDNTVLLYHIDLPGCYEDFYLFARSKVSKATGIPLGNIMMSATHMHSGPDTTRTDIPSIERYNDQLQEALVEAGKLAVADKKTAQMYTTRIYPENLNFVRHYKMSDGTVAGDQFGSFKNATIVDHMTKADNELQVIKFTREGSKDVVMVNWQGHPHRAAYGEHAYLATSDIVGVMRTELEKQMDCQFAYFTGASGNVNNNSKIESEQITKDYLEHGKALADHVVKAAADFKQSENGTVQIIGKNYAGTKADESGTLDLAIFAFSIGEVAFVTAPYEMFDTNGREIKDGSPFETTFVVTCANFAHSYIPSAIAYEYGGKYEIGISKFQQGTAELLVKEYLSMLNQLYKTRN